jgi:type III secretion system FlhB-like substrate exporter
MPANRSAGRDVHIYSPDDLTKPLGDLVVTNVITNANFDAMSEVFVFFSSPYRSAA